MQLFIIIVVLLFFILKMILKRYKMGKVVIDKIEKIIFFNMILRYILESYLDIAICCLINLKDVILIFYSSYTS
jgi:hypothetical protein